MKVSRQEQADQTHFPGQYAKVPKSPTKQFELLYRERDQFPSAEAYESIIFVKSKKCGNRRGKKQSVEQLKKTIGELQKKLKKGKYSSNEEYLNSKSYRNEHSQRLREFPMEGIVKKQSHLKSTSNSNNPFIPVPASSLKLRKERSHKASKPSSHLQVASPVKSKINHKSRSKKLIRPIEVNQANQYVFLGGQFVQIDLLGINFLEQKLQTNRRQVLTEQGNINSKILANQTHQFQLQSEEECLEQQEQEDMEEVREYIIKKTVIIQRWWRDLLAKRVQREEIKPKYTFLQNDNDRSDHREPNMLVDLISSQFETSPIKLIEELRKDEIVENTNPLLLREEAAKAQLNTHIQILQRLRKSQKITEEVFYEKYKEAEIQYAVELTEVAKIRNILEDNSKRVNMILQKTKADLITADCILNDVSEEGIEGIFGSASPSDSPIGQLSDDRILNRGKSNGCHHSISTPKASKYKRTASAEEEDQQISPEEECDFYESGFEEVKGEMGTANFKELMEEYKHSQEVKNAIDGRVARQLGVISVQAEPQKIEINTSIVEMHRFLLSMFKFYTYYHQDEFLQLINTPYGASQKRRLKILQQHCIDEDQLDQGDDDIIYGTEEVIHPDILSDFYSNLYSSKEMTNVQRANLEFQKVHHRAVFDSFNEALNFYRPYFHLRGEPYPWVRTEKTLTFYYISECGIQEVFQKTQFRVLRWASNLCGLHVDGFTRPQKSETDGVDQIIDAYRESVHPFLLEAREERLTNSQKVDTVESNFQWQLKEQAEARVMYDLSQLVLEQISMQLARECVCLC